MMAAVDQLDLDRLFTELQQLTQRLSPEDRGEWRRVIAELQRLTAEDRGWARYQTFVLSEFNRLTTELEKIDQRIDKLFGEIQGYAMRQLGIDQMLQGLQHASESKDVRRWQVILAMLTAVMSLGVVLVREWVQ